MSTVWQVQEFLATHRGRDKILRSIQFFAKLCGGCLQQSGVSSADGLLNVASTISSTRVVLRFMDDVAMVGFLIKGIKQVQLHPNVHSILNLLDTVFGLVFLPIEHLAFFGDQRVASFQTGSLHTSATVLWLASLAIKLFQILMKIVILKEECRTLTLPLLQCLSDLVIAVHYLPKGYLWSEQLPLTAVGVFGLASSLIGLYGLIQSFRESKSKNV